MVLVINTPLCIFQTGLRLSLATLELYISILTYRNVFYDDRKHESNFLCDHQYLFMIKVTIFDFSY